MECLITFFRQGDCKALVFAFSGKRESVLSSCFLLLPGLSRWHKGWAGLKTKKAAFCEVLKNFRDSKGCLLQDSKGCLLQDSLVFLNLRLIFLPGTY